MEALLGSGRCLNAGSIKRRPPPAIGNMVFSDAGMIFMEGYIQTIMEAFSMLLLSPGMRK